MEVAKLVLEYIDTIIYPVLLVFIIVLFKKEFKSLLTGELSGKFKDLSFTIKKKDEEIKAIEANVKDVSKAVLDEIEKVKAKEKWSGFDHEANRLSSAIRKIDLNSDEHIILNYIKSRKGVTSVGELVNDIIKPNQIKEAHVFRAEKARLDYGLEGLMSKGIVSKSDKGNIKLHPWFGPLTSHSSGQAAE